MLHINDLTYRVEGRLLIDHATVALPEGHKVGFVGRNGTGKSTLLKLILGELAPETGSCTVPKNARIGTVAQEAPGGSETLIEVVLAADTERASLLAEAETATDPHRIAEIQTRLADIDAHCGPCPRCHHSFGPWLQRGGTERTLLGVFRRMADARGAGGGAVRRAGRTAA
jgi:ATP-binding cassette subfamily F protein 3